MEHILTATGKNFNVSHCGSMADLLGIIFNGYTITEVVNVFANSEETKTLQYYYEDEMEKEYVGYTDLINVSFSGDNVKIDLRNNNISLL